MADNPLDRLRNGPTTTTVPGIPVPVPAGNPAAPPTSSGNPLMGGGPALPPPPSPVSAPVSPGAAVPALSGTGNPLMASAAATEQRVLESGADALTAVWTDAEGNPAEEGRLPSAAEQEADPVIAEKVTELLSFLSRMWAHAKTLPEDSKEREDLENVVSSTLGVAQGIDETITGDGLDYRPRIHKDVIENYGLTEAIPEGEGEFRKTVNSMKGGMGWALGGNPIGRAVMTLMSPVIAVGEGVATAVALGVNSDDDMSAEMLASLGRAVNPWQGQTDDLYGMRDEIDVNRDGSINFREVLGIDPNFGGDSWMGLVTGAIDTVGMALISPDTYVAVGPAGRARAGLEAAGQVGGRGLVQDIIQNGLRSQTDEVIEAINQQIIKGVNEATEGGKRLPLSQRLRRIGANEQQRAETLRRLQSIEGPQGRIAYAGKGIRTPVDKLIEANPLRRKYGDTVASGNILDVPTTTVRRGVAKIFGEGVDTVTRDANGIKIAGEVRDANNRAVGTFDADLGADGTATLGNVTLEEAAQGRGTGSAFLDQQVQGLTEEGFHTIKLTAEGDGALVWGKKGFEFDLDAPGADFAWEQLGDRLRAKADDLETPGAGSVDEYGYHGTQEADWSLKSKGRNNDENVYGPGLYVSSAKEVGDIYAGPNGGLYNISEKLPVKFKDLRQVIKAEEWYDTLDEIEAAVRRRGGATDIEDADVIAFVRDNMDLGDDTLTLNERVFGAINDLDWADDIEAKIFRQEVQKHFETQGFGGYKAGPLKAGQSTEKVYWDGLRDVNATNSKDLPGQRSLLPGEKMATDGDSQLDALFDEGQSLYPGGNPDELRMLADELDNARRMKDPALLPDPAAPRWQNLKGIVDDTTGFPMVRRLDPADGAQGRVARFLDDPDAQMNQTFAKPVVRKGATDVLVPDKLRGAMDWMRPRAAIKRDGTRGHITEQIIDDARVEAAAVGQKVFQQMADEMNSAAKDAAAEVSGKARDSNIGAKLRIRNKQLTESISDADMYVKAALEGQVELARDVLGLTDEAMREMGPEEFAELAATRLAAEGMPATADYIRTAARWRTTIDEATVKAGMPGDHLHQFYMPRTLTNEGRKFVNANIDDVDVRKDLGARSEGASLGEFGFQNERVIMPDAPIDDVNKALANKYKLPEGTELFDNSILGAFATRGRSAFRASVEADLFTGLTDEIVDGKSLIVRHGEGPKPEGYASMDTPGGTVYGPKAVLDEFKQVRKQIHDDDWVQGAHKALRNWSQIWGAYATSPLIDGLGFHSRNATGNVMLNALAGVVNPLDYQRAQRVQTQFGKAQRRVRAGQSTWETVWDDLGIKGRQRDLIDGLMDHDIMGAGFFDDIVKGTTDRGKVYEFLGNNKIIRTGRYVGNLVEDNARIAHYINKLNAPGGTPNSAARSVRKFLFDYSDLTAFEQRLRHVSRFYTFMRKNTGVQLWALAHVPGRVNQLNQIQQDTRESDLGNALGISQAGYSIERGDSMQDVLLPGGRAKGLVAGIETPWKAAEETLSGIYEFANLIESALPGDVDVLPGQSSLERVTRAFYNMTAGGEQAFVEFIYEELTQKDIFTGAELDEGAEDKFRKLMDIAIGPLWSQVDSFAGRLTEGEGVGPLGNNMSDWQSEHGRELALMSNVLGLVVAPYGDSQEKHNLYAMNDVLEEYVNSQGLPTEKGLRDTGVLPGGLPNESRAPSITRQETIDEYEADGLDTTELRKELAETIAKEERLGYVYNEDGTYTTREQRTEGYAKSIGELTEAGNPSINEYVKATWNRDHPDDLHLKDDGTPYTMYDVDPVWEVTPTVIEEWAIANGVPLTEAGNAGAEAKRAWNAAHGEAQQYYTRTADRAAAGIVPVRGAYEWKKDDGTVVWIGDVSGPAPSGTSALVPRQSQSSGLSALLGE